MSGAPLLSVRDLCVHFPANRSLFGGSGDGDVIRAVDGVSFDVQKGEIMGRNTCRNPWFNQLDLSVRQSLPGMRGQKLTLQADIFNFLNFLNQDWGQYKQNNRFPQVSLLTVTGQTADGRPTVQMDTRIGDRTFRYPKALNSVSYWQGQVSLRYAF